MPNVRRSSLGILAIVGSSSGFAHAMPATEYPLGKSAAVTSLAGRSASDVYVMSEQGIFHFNGKRAVKTKNQPVCVSTYAAEPSMFPVNVNRRNAELVAREFRARPANAEEDHRWQPVAFTSLANEGSVIRLYGSGDHVDSRGSVRRIFTARLNGDAWVCEGWSGADGATIFDLAHDGESTFVSADSFSNATFYEDPDTFPFAPMQRIVIGVSAAGIHGVWAWDRQSPTAYHLDGFSWDVRPIGTWASVVRVQGAGPGRAFAIGSTTQQREGNSTEIQSDAFAFWNGRAWVAVALPAGFTVQPRGLLVDSSERVLLVGDEGLYYWYESGTLKPDTGPRIRITAVWRSPTQHWFLGGACGEEDCVAKIGGPQ